MATITNYLANLLVDWYWRGQPKTPPATFYKGLIVATRGYSSSNRSTAVNLGDTMIPATPNGHIYECTTAGTTGASEPAWPTGSGSTVTDGTAVWTEQTTAMEAGTVKEVTNADYGRVAVTAGLTEFAGTQAAGSITASTGTSKTTSNNSAITFPAPSTNWGVIWGEFWADAANGGNILSFAALAAPQTVNAGATAPSFAPAASSFQFDSI